jgi:pimeloyl-ACP methyl ester carboxylesterase
MDHADLDGLRVGYERAGSGPPLVLVHGYVGDGPTTWRPQLNNLSADFTVVAWDAPGTGESSDPPEDFGIAGYADCLAHFLRAIGLERPYIVGLSFGGALAIELNRRHPDVAAGYVVVSGYAGWLGSLSPELAAQRLDQALQLATLSPDEFVDALLPTMFAEGTPSETIDAFGEAMRHFHPAGFRALARACFVDLRDALELLRAPTLLIYGNHDARAPAHVADQLHRAIAGSKLELLPGAGHLCNLEAPDAFNDLIRSFTLR